MKNLKFLLVITLAFETSAVASTPAQIAQKIEAHEITSVIFDVNGVLLTKSTLKSIYSIAGSSLLEALLKGHRFWDQKILFQALSQVRSTYHGPTLYHDGLPMPGIMADWLVGNVSSEEALKRCHQEITSRDVLPEILNLMFDPASLAFIHKKDHHTWDLLETVRSQNLGTYVLSNMDAETARLLRIKFPEIFAPMLGQIWSGEVHLAKPDPEIFRKALSDFHISPEKTLFIDDEPANLEGARSVGLEVLGSADIHELSHLLKHGHRKSKNQNLYELRYLNFRR